MAGSVWTPTTVRLRLSTSSTTLPPASIWAARSGFVHVCRVCCPLVRQVLTLQYTINTYNVPLPKPAQQKIQDIKTGDVTLRMMCIVTLATGCRGHWCLLDDGCRVSRSLLRCVSCHGKSNTLTSALQKASFSIVLLNL